MHFRVFSVLVVLGLVASVASAQDITVKSGHPRVMLTKDDIARAAKNIEAGGANWQLIRSRIDDGSAPVQAYAVAYLATGDKAVGAKGVEKLMQAGDVEQVALGYDWLYALLTNEQKKALFEKVSGLVQKDFEANMSAPWTNFVQRASYRSAVAGAAFAPDFPEAKAWLDKAYKDWTEFHLPASLITGKGGGWPEGTLYSYIVYNCLARLADVLWTSTDTNIYGDTPWFADRLAWWRFHVWPMPKNFHGRLFYMYHPYGDSERWRAPMQNQEIAAELLVMRYLGETDAVKEWRWFMRQLGGPIGSLGQWELLAYYDETAPVKEPTGLSWISPGTGQIFIRSSWSPDATWVAYQCGPRFTYHQHLDQGSFYIFKQGDLVGESGVYEPSGPSDEDGHLQAYCSRAAAHNTINIYHPNEVFSGYRSGNSPRNDGGERTWRPYSNTATSAAYWHEGFDKGAYDTGRITEFKDEGDFVYIASDLTGAYNSVRYISGENISKVDEVTRQLVYFRPKNEGDLDCLVVFDRVRATDPAFEKRVLIQIANDARVAGKDTRVDGCETHFDGDFAQLDVGGGRLFIRSLLPEKPKIAKLTAPDKQHWVFGKNYPVANTPWERDYGFGRLEIMPTDQAKDHCFLTVFFPADKSASSAPPVRLVKSEGGAAVEILAARMNYSALFATGGEMGCRVSVGSGGDRVLSFGNGDFLGGTWKVAATNDRTLPALQLSDVAVTDVTTEATVAWKTSEPTVGYVEFGPDMNMKYLIQPSEKLATEHKMNLRGLEPLSTWYVRAASIDKDGNRGFSKMFTLAVPPDATRPRIFDAGVERANPTDVTISWSTDDATTGTVEVAGTGGVAAKAQSTTPAPDHRVTVEGLSPSMQYEAVITAANSSVRQTTSEMLPFRTPPKPEGYFETDFSSGEIGPFTSADPALWKIWDDSASGSKALALSNEARARTQMVYTGGDYGDFTLKCKARTLEGGGNSFRDYCVVFGWQDSQNYYAAWFCGGVDGSIPGVVRMKDGNWELIGERPNIITLQDREWHNIEIVRKGTQMQVFFDGLLAFEADDATFGKGKVGFGANNDSASFDDLKVLPYAEVSKSPPKIRTKVLTVEGLVKE